MQHEIDHEHEKEKREVERARKYEQARCAKEAYALGGQKALMKGKCPCPTQD
jgi:hypothetical protein